MNAGSEPAAASKSPREPCEDGERCSVRPAVSTRFFIRVVQKTRAWSSS